MGETGPTAARKEGWGVVLFHTTAAALRAERVLLQGGVGVKPIPTPREFSSDCGIALRFDWASCETVQRLLGEGRVPVAGVHPVTQGVGRGARGDQ